MSAMVAEMAAEVGHDLYRPGKKKAAQLLLGLPDNEYLAICYSAYKHDKRLPSVALVDTTQTAANLQYHYEVKVKGQAQFAALTFPALERRVSIDGYESGLALAFKRMNKLKKALKKSGLGEFVYAQLEAPFEPKTETFYLHFHIFLTFDFGDQCRKQALTFIHENTPWLQSKAGVQLKRIADGDVARFIRYGTKPSVTAYEIAKSENMRVFEAFLNVSKGRRLTRTEGALKTTLKQLKDQGRRTVFHKCERTGQSNVALVEKGTIKDLEKPSPGETATVEKPSSPRKNIYCGACRPVTSPEGRLLAFGMVQDFCEDSFDIGAGEGVAGSLFEANRIARSSWERNTGKCYDLKDFLAPITDDIMRLIKDADVQSYTVIVSPKILAALREIKEERKSGVRRAKPSSKSYAPETSFWSKLKLWGSKLVAGVSRIRVPYLDWIR